MKGSIYLIPSLIGENDTKSSITPRLVEVINTISTYIVENERSARRFLKIAGIEKPIDSLKFFVLNNETPPGEISRYLDPIENGADAGIISEAGCPGIADPGAEVVKLAHQKGIKVIPLVGASSIFMALMASGMNGQNFAFTGYLPIKKPDRVMALKTLEKRSIQENQTQIFMETPYRNNQLLADILTVCKPNTHLCIACDITLETEYIKNQTIKQWKNDIPDIDKRPAIFLLHSN